MLGVSPLPDSEPLSCGIILACPWAPHEFDGVIKIARNPSERCHAGGGIADRQLGMMVGNALSVNVLERLLVRMLKACGLRRPLHDRWIA